MTLSTNSQTITGGPVGRGGAVLLERTPAESTPSDTSEIDGSSPWLRGYRRVGYRIRICPECVRFCLFGRYFHGVRLAVSNRLGLFVQSEEVVGVGHCSHPQMGGE